MSTQILREGTLENIPFRSEEPARTEVSWDNFGLLAFFRNQNFKPSNRLCLECDLDPTQADNS